MSGVVEAFSAFNFEQNLMTMEREDVAGHCRLRAQAARYSDRLGVGLGRRSAIGVDIRWDAGEFRNSGPFTGPPV